jgi:hypothetical protein
LPVVKRTEVVKGTPLKWVDAGPPLFPVIDVVPEAIKPNSPRANVRVRLNFIGVAEEEIVLTEQVWIFPLGQAPSHCEVPYNPEVTLSQLPQDPWIRESSPIDISTLDGHVVLRWPDNRWLISTFSQGGDGPNSSRPFPANPMNAGSSDGSALLLMYKDGKKPKERNDTKVVTSIVYGFPERTSAGTKQADRSYIFSIASNNALPPFNPTLLLYYDPISETEQYTLPEGDLRICRWIDGKGWTPIPTYIPVGFRFAIAPLDQTSGGILIDTNMAQPEARIEYYKVAWVSLDS